MVTVQDNDTEIPDKRVAQVVGQTWRLLTGRPPEPGMSLAEAGGDSLSVIEIIFNLERLLAGKLPMDRFHSGLTAEEFAREALASISIDHNDNQRPQTPIFFCRPALGDSGFLADFRRSGGDNVRFVAIEYPDLPSSVSSNFGHRSVIDAVLAQIRAQVPSGPVRLAGYSWGCRIAFEAAARLEAEGREVSFLGILDAPAPGLIVPRVDGAVLKLRAWCRAVYLLAVLPREERNRRLGRRLARHLALEWAAPLRRLLEHRSARRANVLRIGSLFDWTIFNLRGWLLSAAWERGVKNDLGPGPKLAAPLVLFRCAEELAGVEPDFGWGRVAENVTIVSVPGDHVSTVGQAHVESTASAFIEALGVIERNRLSRRGQVV